MTSYDTTHEMYEELAVGHALSALEPEDEQVFLRHLPGCAACAAAVSEHSETLTHLAYAAVSDSPPASILEGIRAGVAESGRSGAFPAPVSLDAARTRRRDKTVRATTAILGAAASLILVAALVLMNRGLQSKADQQQQATDKLNLVVKTLLVDGSREVKLTGSAGKAVVVVNGSKVSFAAAGLPTNDRSSSIYVLWAKSVSGGVNAVGTFDIRSGEPTVVNDLKVGNPNEVAAFIVTKERGRQAPALSTQPAVVEGSV
ncbi:MAG: putative transrane anti-sigma factor [Frankiales bacterium]|nr:putative transrane anti-sigma factor [Frankiales bacterium]